MATSAVQQTLSRLSAGKSSQTSQKDRTEGLGSQQFMKLLIAQLKHQSPLKPASAEKFSDQLAQYTQVESLSNIDKKMALLLDKAASSQASKEAAGYIGMRVTGSVNTMTIDKGNVTPGFYELSKSADVKIVIKDDKGNVVKTITQGQQKKGAYLINWNGTSDSGKPLSSGTYTYKVYANNGSGFKEVPTTVTGTVDAVAYQNGKAYLVVGRVLVDPASLTSVTKPESSDTASKPEALLHFLGKTVTSNFPIVQVKDGKVAGKKLGFSLDKPQDVTVKIYDANNKLVKTIKVPAKDTVAGKNGVKWDGLSESGSKASDGLYYYRVETEDGQAVTPVSGKVTGIQYIDGIPFLELGESGRLVSISKIDSIK